MERGDFISGEAWCKYKFERESKNEEIERLQRRVERASKNLHNRIVYDNIVLTVLSVTIIAVLAGWIKKICRIGGIGRHGGFKSRCLRRKSSSLLSCTIQFCHARVLRSFVSSFLRTCIKINTSIKYSPPSFAGKTVCGTQACPPFWAHRDSRSIYFRSSVGRARHF